MRARSGRRRRDSRAASVVPPAIRAHSPARAPSALRGMIEPSSGTQNACASRIEIGQETDMTTIVAGRFDEAASAEGAIAALLEKGFHRTDAGQFFVNPAGQHAELPTGGDQFADAESSKAHVGAGVGAAAGGAVGIVAAAAIPGLGAALALGLVALGAYTGSFAGAMAKLGDDSAADDMGASPGRKSGGMVAVRVLNAEAERIAIDTLRTHGAQDVERAEGEWRDGNWQDFDPVQPPHRVE